MSTKRNPIRYETETVDGTAVHYPVYELVCARTGETFEHVQRGRGRPPLYSPEGRTQLDAERATHEPVDRSRMGEVRRANTILRAEIAENETPEPGDIVMRLTTGMKRESALRWMVPVRLVSVDGDTATVERRGEQLTTRFANLVKVTLS